MRALDIQMELHKWYQADYGVELMQWYMEAVYAKGAEEINEEWGEDRRQAFRGYVQEENKVVPETFWRGDTCYVTSEMMHLVMQAAHDMKGHEIRVDFRNLMTPIGFVLMEEGIYGLDGNGCECGFHAIAWNATHVRYNPDTDEVDRALDIFFLSSGEDQLTNGSWNDLLRTNNIPVPSYSILHTYRMFENELIKEADDTVLSGSEIVEELLKVFYSIQLLSHQTIGKPIAMRPDRASRKRFHREHPDEPERLVTLITLRRKTVKKDDEQPQKVEWSRRWVVRGFWRRQYYPGSKRHDWKYIHEYIKGPEDKPLVITERRVFDFRR